MNEIVMIPMEKLEHHPENPRKDLGDLTELTESIRKNGIMQNLTVVKNMFVPDMYTVVIGNRRMEAARAAGLAEVPCVISNMDPRTQIATMLEENMQRADLTIYEQAQGFQLMMDLGYTAKEISEKTGFGETTVRRRLKMAELDQETLREKCTQLTMDDLDRLSRIKDLDKRNELLKQAGTSSFNWKVDDAITEQKRKENYQLIREILLQAGYIEKSTAGMSDFWKTCEYLPFETRIILANYEDGQNVLPEDPAGERQVYFYKDYSHVRFWAEKRPEEEEEEETEEEREEREEEKRKQQEARDAWERLKNIEDHAKESRKAFLEGLTVKQKDNRKALEWMMIGLVVTNNETPFMELLPDWSEEEVKGLPDDLTEVDMDLEWTREQIQEDPQLYAKVMGILFFADEDCVQSRWRTSQKPEYCRNLAMITGYEWLKEFGYQVSDDEKAYLDGTLDCYAEVDE